jgi:hypothetical protein
LLDIFNDIRILIYVTFASANEGFGVNVFDNSEANVLAMLLFPHFISKICFQIILNKNYFFLGKMVRKYIKKHSKDPKYLAVTLKAAIHEVRIGHMTAYKAAREFSIPYSTIYTHLKGLRGIKKEQRGRCTALPLADEQKLANSLKLLEKWGFGLSRKEILQLVGNYVLSNKVQTPFKNGIPGEDWFLSFKKRYNLSIKVPQSVEYARKKATDPFIIFGYFDLLERMLAELNLFDKPQCIWNLDETSLSLDPGAIKVVGERGKPATRTTSTSGRENTTILAMANAAGGKAPPLIIFKGRFMWDQWCAPKGTGYPGTVYAASKNGWMESEIFRNYFFNTVLPTLGEERPVLIIYDGHSTHIDEQLISRAIQENIVILKLPPHTSHLLQPLDLSVFKSFKSKWNEKLVAWQRQNVGRKLPKSIFSQFVGNTWASVTEQTIKTGFRKGGIHPFNSKAIGDDKFQPDTLERWHNAKQHPVSDNLNEKRCGTQIQNGSNNGPVTSISSAVEDLKTSKTIQYLPSTSSMVEFNVQNDGKINPVPSTSSVLEEPNNNSNESLEKLILSTIKQIQPTQKQRRKRVCAGAEVITQIQVVERIKKKNEMCKISNRKKQSKREKILDSGDEDVNEEEEEEVGEEVGQKVREEVGQDDEVNINKWVLVEYYTKKTIRHFVGQVIGSSDEGWDVKYVKKSSSDDYNIKFVWPVFDDTDTVSDEDIKKILPDPTIIKRGFMEFSASLFKECKL